MKKYLFTLICLAAPFSHAEERPTNLTETAILAGGCFWCIQHDYKEEESKGWLQSEVGYTGGHTNNPTYKQVSKTNTGHYEAMRIFFDPTKVTYEDILNRFWPNVDAVDNGGQFCDRGDSYRPAVFVLNEEQRTIAEATKTKAQDFLTKRGVKKTINTPILDASTFYVGEGYHQHYSEKNPTKYKYYRWRCGRDQRLEELWGAGIDTLKGIN